MNYNEYRLFVNNHQDLFEQYAEKMISVSSMEQMDAIAKQCAAEIMVLLTNYKRNMDVDDAMNTAVKIVGEEVLPLVKKKSDYYAELYGYTKPSSSRQINSFQNNNKTNWSTSFNENYNNDESLKMGGIISLVIGGIVGIVALKIDSVILLIIAIFLVGAGIESLVEYNKKR